MTADLLDERERVAAAARAALEALVAWELAHSKDLRRYTRIAEVLGAAEKIEKTYATRVTDVDPDARGHVGNVVVNYAAHLNPDYRPPQGNVVAEFAPVMAPVAQRIGAPYEGELQAGFAETVPQMLQSFREAMAGLVDPVKQAAQRLTALVDARQALADVGGREDSISAIDGQIDRMAKQLEAEGIPEAGGEIQ